MRKNLWLIALCLLTFSQSYAQRTIYVSKGGTNNPPYTNWPDAATNIQTAINVATNSDVVQLSNDVYVSTGAYASNSFLFITNGITLRGFSAQSPTNTVIDGGNPTFTNGCIYMNNANARLEQVWVRNGYTTLSNLSFFAASGVRMENGTISNCWVTACTNKTYGAAGVAMVNGLLTDCMISNNMSVRAAAGNDYGNRVQAGGVLTGGGKIYNCQIVSNRVNTSGGGVLDYGGVTVISNCNISYNYASSYGAGLFAYIAKLYNCTVIGNTSGSVGGGISTAIAIDIANCSVISNYSGAWGGGMSCDADINVTMKNCLFFANSAGNAGGVSWRVASNNSKMESCTIVSNVAYSTHSGGIRNYMGATETNSLFLNCIIYFNSATTVGNDFYSAGADPSLDQRFQYCCINSNLSKAVGLVTANPRLVNLAGGDCRLTAYSPCINMGSNVSWMTTATDLAGNPRIDHLRNTVDIGAYEFFYKGMILMGR